jgi:hypothetical protein
MLSSLIDGLITLALGVWVALIGFGVVSPSKDKKKGEEWRQKWGGFMKVAGLLMAAWGAYYVARRL